MSFRIASFLKAASGLGWCLLAMCSSIPPLAGNGGSGTITGNPSIIVGQIVDSLNRPLKGAHVTLRKNNYLTPLPGGSTVSALNKFDTTTDTNGLFSIGPVDTGMYLIEADSGRSSSSAFRCTVPGDGKTVNAGANIIRTVCVVHGMVSPDLLAGKQLYVQIYGLERIAPVNMLTGLYIFHNVPAGSYDLALSWGDQPVQLGDIEARSGETVSVTPFNAWLYTDTIYLNTSATGANVANNVRNFPVLIRLTSDNFNFTQAKTNGEDIRFMKSNSKPLPYEIERWNHAAQQAEIWVNVDTVHGNNSTQSITMFWGNPDAVSASSGVAVFDSGNGFQGVWHLAESAANSTISDAMGRYDGVMMSGTSGIRTTSVSQNGVISGAIGFQGDLHHWINLGTDRPYLKSIQEFTISLWMNASIDSQISNQLISISKGGVIDTISPESRAEMGINNNEIFFHVRDMDSSSISVTTTSNLITVSQWFNITSVVKIPQDSIYLYVNGEPWQARSNSFSASATDMTNSLMSAIGSNDNGKFDHFSGMIDETRMETTARSPDWIKLCYMNQKQNDPLVVFR